MCGISAISRSPFSSIPDGRKAILAGLIAIEARGPDSTGVAWTRGKQQKVWYHKLVGTASKVARDLDLDGKSRIHTAIGHTRWASQGAVNYTNAHPVVADNIVLVHNGCLDNDDDLIRLSGMKRVGQVDSWALPAVISRWREIGADHPADVLELVEGDAAMAWFDSQEPRLMHLARLQGRPMTIGWTKRGDLVMSSTRQTLQRTATLMGVAVGDMIDVAEGTYLKVMAGHVIEWRTITLPVRKPVVRRPLWTPTEGSPAPKRPITRNYSHGITDLVANRPDDWWDEAERLLGDAAGERPGQAAFDWDDDFDRRIDDDRA